MLSGTKKVGVDDFNILKVIGRGAFGKVMLVEKKDTRKIYAMKSLKKNMILEKEQITNTKTEKYILEKIKHPFLTPLEFAFQSPGKFFFIMPFYRGGELFQHLILQKRFTPKRTQFYAAQIVLGLEYLHQNDIIYRDLKPENILLDDDGYICLADFGMSKILNKQGVTDSLVGTPEYMAPEVLNF